MKSQRKSERVSPRVLQVDTDREDGWPEVITWNAADWDSPNPAPQTREQMRYIDRSFFIQHVSGFIPFWIKGVEGAERGEEWRLEEYLEGRDDTGVCQPLGLSSANQQDSDGCSDGEMGRFEAWGPTRNDALEWDWDEDVNNNWCRSGGWDDKKREHCDHNAVSDNWAAPAYERWDSPVGSEDSWNEAPRKRKAKKNTKRKIHTFADDIARKDLAGSERTEKLHQFVDMSTDNQLQTINQLIHDLRSS